MIRMVCIMMTGTTREPAKTKDSFIPSPLVLIINTDEKGVSRRGRVASGERPESQDRTRWREKEDSFVSASQCVPFVLQNYLCFGPAQFLLPDLPPPSPSQAASYLLPAH